MKTIGILGGGQLGRMLALAGYPLGYHFRILDPSSHAPAGKVAQRISGDYANEETLQRFVSDIDVATYEFENVPIQAVRWLEERVPVYPPSAALEAAQDRLKEKTLFQKLDIPVPPFASVNSLNDLEAAIKETGFPCVLKTCRFGYDGKGQWVLRTAEDVAAAWKAQENNPVPLILEGFVNFERELSLIGVRSVSGETLFYPLVENRHKEGILRLSLAPAPDVTAELQAQAESMMRRVMEAVNYVGVLAIEFFQLEDTLLANEMAPRVHNSGHWTIEGAECSQFENHLRAICNLPLGSTRERSFSAMWNILGNIPSASAVLSIPGAHLHLYDKSGRAGRKVGHITLCANSADEITAQLNRLREVAPQE